MGLKGSLALAVARLADLAASKNRIGAMRGSTSTVTCKAPWYWSAQRSLQGRCGGSGLLGLGCAMSADRLVQLRGRALRLPSCPTARRHSALPMSPTPASRAALVTSVLYTLCITLFLLIQKLLSEKTHNACPVRILFCTLRYKV